MSRPLEPGEWALLGVLALGPAHGYDAHAFVSEHLGAVWQLGLSRTYAILTRLEKAGLIDHHKVAQSDRPAKKIFDLTEEGRVVYEDWLARPVDNIRDMRLEFLMKLFFAERTGQETLTGLLAAQLKTCQDHLARLEQSADRTIDPVANRAIGYRIHMTRATCDWIESLNKK